MSAVNLPTSHRGGWRQGRSLKIYIYIYLFNLCQAGLRSPHHCHTTFALQKHLKNTQKHVQIATCCSRQHRSGRNTETHKNTCFRKIGPQKHTKIRMFCFGATSASKIRKHTKTRVFCCMDPWPTRETHKNTCFFTHGQKHTKTCVFWFSASLGTPGPPRAAQVTPKRPKRPQRYPKGTPRRPPRDAKGTHSARKEARGHTKETPNRPTGTPKDTKGRRRCSKAPRRVPKRTGNARKFEKPNETKENSRKLEKTPEHPRKL